MQFEFTAFPRGTEGRGASRRLRRTGRAPGIVYGGTESRNRSSSTTMR